MMKRRRWDTTAEQRKRKARKLAADRKNKYEIAKILRVTKWTVYTYLKTDKNE